MLTDWEQCSCTSCLTAISTCNKLYFSTNYSNNLSHSTMAGMLLQQKYNDVICEQVLGKEFVELVKARRHLIREQRRAREEAGAAAPNNDPSKNGTVADKDGNAKNSGNEQRDASEERPRKRLNEATADVKDHLLASYFETLQLAPGKVPH
ncbi:hypothetical protein Q1695_000721 [Nippostrongylus brasiliensis]|nr:hypothetical protein Q1695_000721 [Nippostrongylus brasiliensis]